MTTQFSILKALPAGLMFTSAKLFAVGSPDTVVTGNTFSFSNRTNATSQYVVSIERVAALPAGDYTLIAYIGTKPTAELQCTFAGTDGETATETPEAAVLDTAAQAMVAAFNAMRAGNVFTAPALVNAPGGAGGGWTADQIAQVARIESQTAKLSGSPVTVNGNVKPGGQIVVTQGDDHTVALGNPVIVPVDDVGGALHTLMAAVGVGNLSIVAIRGVDPASRVSGTVAALSYASNVLSVTMQFTATETAKGVVGPAYNYDVIKTDTPTRTYFSGRLTVQRNAR